MKLDNLKVISFQTDLNDTDKKKVKGGKPDFYTEITCWQGCASTPFAGCWYKFFISNKIKFIMKKKVKLEALKIESFITKLDGYDRHEVLGGAKQASYSRIIICPIDETFW